MLVISQRLADLDHKGKFATRTAKDGEEYSQLVIEVSHEIHETETNSLCGSPQAFAAYKAVFRAVKQTTEIPFEERIDNAVVGLRLGAVNAINGPEFSFKDSRIDNFVFSNGDGEALNVSYRITTKPALDANFGELVARAGHTVMVEVRGEVKADQAELPLGSVGAGETGTSSIGSPEQERERAHKRERKIARDLEEDREENPVH